jgi:hypothetical protein
VPVHELLPAGDPMAGAVEPAPRLVLDLERLGEVELEEARLLGRYAATIQAQRGDYNGRVLSIRRDDLRTLAVLYDTRPGELAERLVSWGVLHADSRPRDVAALEE